MANALDPSNQAIERLLTRPERCRLKAWTRLGSRHLRLRAERRVQREKARYVAVALTARRRYLQWAPQGL